MRKMKLEKMHLKKIQPEEDGLEIQMRLTFY